MHLSILHEPGLPGLVLAPSFVEIIFDKCNHLVIFKEEWIVTARLHCAENVSHHLTKRRSEALSNHTFASSLQIYRYVLDLA